MTASTTPELMPYVIVAVVCFALYRRIRSHFGWQPWRQSRTTVRVAVMSVALAALAAMAAINPAHYWGIAVGGAVGAGLGVLALRLLSVDAVDGQPGYTPNPWIGGALTALLVARIAWRVATGGYMTPQASSPLTFAVAAAVVAFYLMQGIGLMRLMRSFAPAVAAPRA
ncbi:DUF1453 family protein [Cognatilysobacter lacus]|nr:DUF1453 family protein [Lysobacter lacus]